ncbi:MAG: hypothetical protein ACRD5Z_03575 [Bryobacteraceae bacterium]
MKTKSKQNILVASLLGLAALFTITLLPAPALAHDVASESSRAGIAGLWESTVEITNCQSGTVLATFRGLGLFHRGGGLEQQNNMSPILGKTALGSWQYLGANHFAATFRFFRFDPNGIYIGIQKVTRDIQLDAVGNTFTSVISSTTYDVNNNIIATGCGTETATRAND